VFEKNLNSVREGGVMPRDPKRWLTLIALCLSTLVLVIDAQVLVVAIPSLTRDLHATAQDVQWINSAYQLVLAGLILTAGSLSDRFGRRRMMVIGLGVFGLASLPAAFATSPGMLIAARAVMGAGAASVFPGTMSILITVFDDDERPKAIAAWSAVAMAGLVGGPVLGGVLTSRFWWGSVFLINVPIAVLAIGAAIALMPESRGPPQTIDALGAGLSIGGMAALVWSIITLPVNGLTPAVAGAGAAAIVALVGFGARERHAAEPLVPLGLFRQRNFSGSCLSLTLVYVGYGGLLLALTQYLQFVLGYTPMQAGLALLPMAGALVAASSLGGRLSTRLGNRTLMTGGFVVMAAGFGLLSTVPDDATYLIPGLAMALLGVGAGLAQLTAIAVLMGAVPEPHAGVGSALNDTMQQAGAVLGVAILGSILAEGYTAHMPDAAPDRARASIAQAIAVAEHAGDTGLAQAARHAYTRSMSLTLIVGAVTLIAAAVLSFAVIRDRDQPPA
jgi:MFS transporter, DHA2 family, multidrug resistance protein